MVLNFVSLINFHIFFVCKILSLQVNLNDHSKLNKYPSCHNTVSDKSKVVNEVLKPS